MTSAICLHERAHPRKGYRVHVLPFLRGVDLQQVWEGRSARGSLNLEFIIEKDQSADTDDVNEAPELGDLRST